MDAHEQNSWIAEHIPYRVRAAIARLHMENSLLRVHAFLDPAIRNDEQKIYWRCATDAIWEGRLAATRWLIEFVGVKQDGSGNSTVSKPRKGSTDIWIENIDGGVRLDPASDHGRLLAKIWKGCSQASSHATSAYNRPSVDEKDLVEALNILMNHLQATIYDAARKHLRDYVLRLPST